MELFKTKFSAHLAFRGDYDLQTNLDYLGSFELEGARGSEREREKERRRNS